MIYLSLREFETTESATTQEHFNNANFSTKISGPELLLIVGKWYMGGSTPFIQVHLRVFNLSSIIRYGSCNLDPSWVQIQFQARYTMRIQPEPVFIPAS